ncbi:LacI family DNA-binding transcriptional regulator [Halothermothrix orenii]|uniref:Transcriptional regulator, LacI family n=1 Tax=Halothermothrix orenii (strain H 168 / OCM 544 / DSM 9562) TaxID=373903 RepID=B8D195_HALOH|nr:LacI family DNA-binding transcriptional regulator [Halothermothrix orenii]ACL71047.1 transcriptional regulator, LacI family [Halothermothrix orenii H 168]
MAVTIKDIARAAGVSKTTVSRALNNKGRISPETREKILKIAAKMNYRHNKIATSLRSNKSMVIGLIFPGFMAGHFYSEIFHGIEAYCTEKGFGVLIGCSDGLAQKEEEIIKLLQERRVDGIIIAPTHGVDLDYYHQFKKEKLPFIFIDKYIPGIEADRIVVDNKKGAYLAVTHLIERGHKKIALLSGPEYPCTTIEGRLEGYLKALEDNGLTYRKIIKTDKNVYNQRESGYKATKEFIKDNDGVTAIFAINDSVAIGAMRAIREAGLRVPQDMAIVGFNDDDISLYIENSLTTISVPKYKLGEKAAQLILERIEGQADTGQRIITLEPDLVVRDTT